MTSPLRRPLIAGNWKMHKTLAEAVELVRALQAGLGALADREVAVFPPFTALTVTAVALKESPIRLGAQDVSPEPQGAFTGEVSAAMLADAGCRYVLCGHSERRRLYGDTDALVGRKVKAVLAAGLVPVACVGETLEQREGQETYRVLERQLDPILEGLAPAQASQLVIAYEPVWAIGTGRTARPDQAQDAHLFIRKHVAKRLGAPAAEAVRLLYGGSVKPDNADALMAEPDLDGALVGGESLKAEGFLRIVKFQSLAKKA